jgi:predicted enzyme related to lactoylglutathione lyase
MGRTVLVMAIGSLHELVFDCSNPEALARFWQALIGGEVEVESADWAVLDGDELGFYIGFQRVPERKTAKNRLHLDVEVSDLDSAVDNAELLGAGTIGARVNEDGGSFQVMADPGGNEFCFITSG